MKREACASVNVHVREKKWEKALWNKKKVVPLQAEKKSEVAILGG